MTLREPKLVKRLQDVLSAENANFDRLVEIAGLDPKRDFRFADLREVDFSGSTLIGWDFTGADLREARFIGARIANCNFTNAVGLNLAGSIEVSDLVRAVDGRVGYLGVPGGYAHSAASELYSSQEAVGFQVLEECLASIQAGEIEVAVVPVDVDFEDHYAMSAMSLVAFSGLHVIGEYFMNLEYDLLGRKGSRLESKAAVTSDIQTFRKCRRKLRKFSIRRVHSSQPQSAARSIVDSDDPAQLAIGSPLAAKLYDLEILLKNIEDDAEIARFVVISRDSILPQIKSGRSFVTSLAFVPRMLPSVLHTALGAFASTGISISRLEQGMREPADWVQKTYYLDVETHPDSTNGALAFEELKFFSREFRIFGVYPAHPRRERSRVPLFDVSYYENRSEF